MAFFRIEIKNHGRGMVGRQAYRFGTKEFDKYHQRHFDYRSKNDVVHREVIMPVGAPEWAHKETEFWKQAEKAAARQDARIAKEFIVSLPRELDLQSGKRLVKEFIDQEFTKRGLGATMAIHSPSAADGQRNTHAHILVSMRPIQADGFANKKLRFLDSAKGIREVRAQWAQTLNREFARQNLPERFSAQKVRHQVKVPEVSLTRGREKAVLGGASRPSGLRWAGRTPAFKRVSSQLSFYNKQLKLGRIPNPLTNKSGAIKLARKLGRQTYQEDKGNRREQKAEQGYALALTRDIG